MTFTAMSNPVLEAIYHRRATRAFAATAVTEAQIETLLQAAVHAPTSRHVEPWAFVVVQDRALLGRISDRTKALMELPTAADHRALVTSEPLDVFHGAGTLIVICTRWPGAFASADCWLAAQNLMLAATSLGLATCPVGVALPALEDDGIRAELAIPVSVTVVAPIVVGVAAASVPAQSRRAPEILAWRR